MRCGQMLDDRIDSLDGKSVHWDIGFGSCVSCRVYEHTSDFLMSADMTDNSGLALECLTCILRRAIQDGADEVRLEWVEGGLEILFVVGSLGTGELLEDSELAKELMGIVVDQAKLERRAKGTMAWSVKDWAYTITVREYESFGETCFRLTFGK